MSDQPTKSIGCDPEKVDEIVEDIADWWIFDAEIPREHAEDLASEEVKRRRMKSRYDDDDTPLPLDRMVT